MWNETPQYLVQDFNSGDIFFVVFISAFFWQPTQKNLIKCQRHVKHLEQVSNVSKTLREVVCKTLSMYGYLVIISKKQSNKDIIFDFIYFDQQGKQGNTKVLFGLANCVCTILQGHKFCSL